MAGKESLRERSGIGRTADMLYSKLEFGPICVSRNGFLGPSAVRERRSEGSWQYEV